MKKLLVLLMALLPFFAVGQTVPDEDDVLSKTTDSQSPYYFPVLMMRYNAGDTTLTLKDYHYLYYGFAFTDAYKPLRAFPSEDKILSVFEQNEQPDYDGMLTIIENAEKALEIDPFSPKDLNYLAYAYGAIGDTVKERIYYDKMSKILKTIEDSGTGRKESSPMHILMFSHAADLLASKGLVVKNRQVVARNVEFIFLNEKDADKQQGYYFDFSRIYATAPDEAPKRERKWQFNNLPVK